MTNFMSKDKRGGFRPGAGRKKSEDPPRTLRGFRFTDEEWLDVQTGAARRGMSTRAYVSWLVTSDIHAGER
jgi:hypothetical protein